jgi:YesN/AraC family two-component response regulator
MLLLCAESLSSGREDYHEILRRRAEQQRVISGMIDELKKNYPAGSADPGYPLDKERLLIAALRRGDHQVAAAILNEVLATLIFANSDHFRYIQLRAIELAVLLSRVENNPGQSGGAALEASNRCLRQVQDAKTIEELTDTLHAIVKRVAGHISSFQGIRHGAALRKAEHFIRENFTRRLTLREIAAVSGLSAPYFSTIFKEEMGENLSKYLNRLRVERASRMLLETDLSLSDIASACCFEDQSWFSKIFKTYTGISPGKYRSQGGGMVREISDNNLSEDYVKRSK